MKNKMKNKEHLILDISLVIILISFIVIFIFILVRQYTWSGVCDDSIKGCKKMDIERYCKYYDVKLKDIKHCLK